MTLTAADAFSAASVTPSHSSGKERDTESGLDYFGARYYGSSMGRFMSPDPGNISAIFHMDDPQAWNGYAYARNNPLKYSDPSGTNYTICDQNGQNCSYVTLHGGEKLMGLFDEQNAEERESEESSSGGYLSLIIFACTLPVLLYFSHIGKTDFGLSIGICLAMNVVAVGMCWDLKRCWWFWVVIVLVLALHIPVVLMIHWPSAWVSKFTLLPIGLADLLLTVGLVRFVEKFIVRYIPPDEKE